MPTFELLGLLVLGVIAWFWYDSAKAREAGVLAVRDACEAEDLQLLDDTVAASGLSLVRNDQGQLALRRGYTFEYSDTGDNRRRGSVVLLGQDVIVINVGLRLVPSDRTLH
jgi:hypothetical protein